MAKWTIESCKDKDIMIDYKAVRLQEFWWDRRRVEDMLRFYGVE